MKTGIELIAIERQEQIEKHGRTVESDVAINPNGELIDAATGIIEDGFEFRSVHKRPCNWNEEIWTKMCGKSYKERLIIAGAFIAAELDRIQYYDKD